MGKVIKNYSGKAWDDAGLFVGTEPNQVYLRIPLAELLAEPAKFEGFNFAMPAPLEVEGRKIGHPLMDGDGEGYTFVDCNFVNRLPPVKAQYGGVINTTLRESQVLKGGDTYEIDGVKKTIGNYVDIVYGKHGYLFPEPKEYPCDGPEDE